MIVHAGVEMRVSQHEKYHVGIEELLGGSNDRHNQLFHQILLGFVAAHQLQLLRLTDLCVGRSVDMTSRQCGEKEMKMIFSIGYPSDGGSREKGRLCDENKTEDAKDTLEGSRRREKRKELRTVCGG